LKLFHQGKKKASGLLTKIICHPFGLGVAQVVELLHSKIEALSSTTTANSKKKKSMPGHQWLTPVIRATQEAKIRRMEV
jgi:hypothetical protein